MILGRGGGGGGGFIISLYVVKLKMEREGEGVYLLLQRTDGGILVAVNLVGALLEEIALLWEDANA